MALSGPTNAVLDLQVIEKRALQTALKITRGVQKDAARLCGVSPRVFNYKIKAHGIVSGYGRRDLPESEVVFSFIESEIIGKGDILLGEEISSEELEDHLEELNTLTEERKE